MRFPRVARGTLRPEGLRDLTGQRLYELQHRADGVCRAPSRTLHGSRRPGVICGNC
ncbi:hypothetical protein ACWC5C_23345 [Streptomyces sp. NPDC001700]